ncbi:hypothetical protein KGB38_gp67 [Salmonella phage vB_SenS_SB28]|uniref:Uncharacterized protein n=1 Tax=Salmonella phage vB_SenS_SB28 TaxID=2591136 RepID=A0A5J6TBT8_9CAUD|nr:hypothetical protein KGB38_gp67 [Salmonella phage vB_SenS_SB28]QFG07808.1 hypothetical protein [Salmonella phage vB_SenS_SB28]
MKVYRHGSKLAFVAGVVGDLSVGDELRISVDELDSAGLVVSSFRMNANRIAQDNRVKFITSMDGEHLVVTRIK